jgi:hypothetical protein
MTIRDLFAVRVLGVCTPVVALALTGCSRPVPPAPESTTVAQAAALAPQPVGPDAGAANEQPIAAPPEPPALAFAFAPDLTGKALPRVVAPDATAVLPGERARTGPKPRTVPVRVTDPEAVSRASNAPPTVPTAKPAASKPSNPAETVPVNFGAGAEDVPAKPVLPAAPVVTVRSRDVNLPPPAPTLGRQATDRVSLDDPTSELGNAEVVAGGARAALEPSAFLKVVVPDPFELADQLKPKVPPSLEPSAAPVPVEPQRVK